jgi:hypothetical protein
MWRTSQCRNVVLWGVVDGCSCGVSDWYQHSSAPDFDYRCGPVQNSDFSPDLDFGSHSSAPTCHCKPRCIDSHIPSICTDRRRNLVYVVLEDMYLSPPLIPQLVLAFQTLLIKVARNKSLHRSTIMIGKESWEQLRPTWLTWMHLAESESGRWGRCGVAPSKEKR